MRAERDRVARGPEREVLEKVFTALLAFTRSLEVQERVYSRLSSLFRVKCNNDGGERSFWWPPTATQKINLSGFPQSCTLGPQCILVLLSQSQFAWRPGGGGTGRGVGDPARACGFTGEGPRAVSRQTN